MTSLLPWSYTKLTSFERCPRMGRARYITKEFPYVESAEAREGNRVHSAIEDLIKEGKQLPNDLIWVAEFIPDCSEGDILLAEHWLNINNQGQATSSRSWFTAKIDLLQVENDDVCWVVDWKTGKPWEDSDQLQVYSSLVKAHYPHLRHWRGFYVWLKEKRVGEVHTLSPAKTLDKLKERVKAVDISDTPKKNRLCDWCELKSCENYTGRKRG